MDNYTYIYPDSVRDSNPRNVVVLGIDDRSTMLTGCTLCLNGCDGGSNATCMQRLRVARAEFEDARRGVSAVTTGVPAECPHYG